MLMHTGFFAAERGADSGLDGSLQVIEIAADQEYDEDRVPVIEEPLPEVIVAFIGIISIDSQSTGPLTGDFYQERFILHPTPDKANPEKGSI